MRDCRQDLHTAARARAEQTVASGLVPVSAFNTETWYKVALEQRARSLRGHSRLRGVPGAPNLNGVLGAGLSRPGTRASQRAPDLGAAVGG